MSEFNYIEYLRKSQKMQTLNENFSPSEDEDENDWDGFGSEDERENYYLDLDSVDENTSYIREKVKEALSGNNDITESDLENDLLNDLEEGYEEEYNPDNDTYNMDSYSEKDYKKKYDKEFDEDFPLEKMNEAKDEDEEDVELEDEVDVEIEDEVSNVGGDSKELTATLMKALETAKSMGNEKLTTQVMNTLKFAIDQSMAD